MSNLPRKPVGSKPSLVFLTIRYDPNKRKQLKVLAARRGTSVTAIVTEAIRSYLAERAWLPLEERAPRMSNGGAPE